MFRTYEPTRDRLVAVKVFKLDITPEQATSLAEALSTAADAGLFHPSIVEPIAAGVEGSVAYRAEEYVAAETLDVALRHYAPAPIGKVLPFITQLAGAIDFARAAGIGHGALHPRDVFVTPEEARASGFGVVDALEKAGIRAPVRRPYTAPERIDGSPWGTPADVFSLAAITYELLTGRRPSGTGSGVGTLAGASVGAAADALLTVIAAAMDPDPARRPATALAYAAALEAASRDEAPAAAPLTSGVAPGSDQGQTGGRPASDPAPAPVVVAPPARPAQTPAGIPPEPDDELPEEIDDDIAAERDEDELHHDLTLRERELEGPQGTLFAEAGHAVDDPEAESDRLLIDAAAIASDDASERFREEFATPVPVPTRSRSDSILRTPEREPEPVPAVVPAQSSRVLPLAAMLAIGLLVGFAVGYGVSSRDPVGPDGAGATATQPAPAATGGKAFSEQAVSQPPATAPAPPPSTSPSPAETRAADTRAERETPPTRESPRPPAVTSGRLTIESVPSRAGVLVNGTWRGRTPLELDKLSLGTHTVRVVQPGFVPSEQELTLTAAAPSRRVSLRLRAQP